MPTISRRKAAYFQMMVPDSVCPSSLHAAISNSNTSLARRLQAASPSLWQGSNPHCESGNRLPEQSWGFGERSQGLHDSSFASNCRFDRDAWRCIGASRIECKNAAGHDSPRPRGFIRNLHMAVGFAFAPSKPASLSQGRDQVGCRRMKTLRASFRPLNGRGGYQDSVHTGGTLGWLMPVPLRLNG